MLKIQWKKHSCFFTIKNSEIYDYSACIADVINCTYYNANDINSYKKEQKS